MGTDVIRVGEQRAENGQRNQNDDDRFGSFVRVGHVAANLNWKWLFVDNLFRYGRKP